MKKKRERNSWLIPGNGEYTIMDGTENSAGDAITIKFHYGADILDDHDLERLVSLFRHALKLHLKESKGIDLL